MEEQSKEYSEDILGHCAKYYENNTGTIIINGESPHNNIGPITPIETLDCDSLGEKHCLPHSIFSPCMGKSVILYAEYGIGKSLLSIGIGLNFKRPLYILVDIGGSKDISQYKFLGDNAVIFTLERLQNTQDNMEQERMMEALLYVNISCSNPQWYERYQRLKNTTNYFCNQVGARPQETKVINSFDVLERIMTTAINEGVDFICIDSLNAAVEDVRRVNRKNLQRITYAAAKAGVTLLCLHHTNKKGDMSGSAVIGEAFDYVCRLSVDTTYSGESNEAVLILDEEKARYSKPQSFRIKRTFTGNLIPEYELLEQRDYQVQQNSQEKSPGLANKIKEVIDELKGSTITFDNLKALLGGNPSPKDGSIKNSLKQLANAGIIRMTYGRWDVITKNLP
jgi:hypothetical protein